jgi:NitT/TauT family transport system substrate-binding protein
MNIRNSHRLSIAVLGCLLFAGEAAFAQKITFTPQWTAQAQFAGYYVAQEMGFYKDAGIEVEIVHPTITQTAYNLIRSGQSQLTTIQLCQAMELINDGVPLVNVLQTSMNNALVIVSKEDRNPLEQKGMRVGTWSAGFDQIAICMALKEGLDYEWFRAASCINLFVAGAFDATLAMSYNEYYLLKQSGVKLTDKNVYRFCDHDYNVQEDGVYTTRSYFETHRDEVLRFAEASKRGWQWAAEHPEETLEIVMKYVKKDNIATNRTLQKLMLEEILRLQVDRESGQREFRLKPEMVELANRLMLDNQILLNEVTYEQLTAH